MATKRVYSSQTYTTDNEFYIDEFRKIYDLESNGDVKAARYSQKLLSDVIRDEIGTDALLTLTHLPRKNLLVIEVFEGLTPDKHAGMVAKVDENNNMLYFEIEEECECELEEMRDSVLMFAQRMEEELKKKDSHYKDGWESLSIDFLTYRMREEMSKLFKSLSIYYANPHKHSRELVQKECADVANFCMMISDLTDKSVSRE